MSSTSVLNTGLLKPTDWFTRAPNYVNATSFGASSGNPIPIVAGTQFMRIAANVDTYVLFGSTLASTGSSTVGAASEFNSYQAGGMLRSIGSTQACTAASFISTLAGFVSFSYWTVG